MRYPVTDEYSIALTSGIYDRMLGRGQPLGTALARAIPEAVELQNSKTGRAISLATPVLLGINADDLVLAGPIGQPYLDPAYVKMERFPREAECFVGRANIMARASVAMAAGNDISGVFFHGMAGSGKTACAVELAYRHEDAFEALAFWRAPENPDEFTTALNSFARTLDLQLGRYGFTLSEHVGTAAALDTFMPRMTRLLEKNGVLIVLDNLETLLTNSGQWKDPMWSLLISALTGHHGESRIVLTSRILPDKVHANVLAVAVHALSLDESAALGRELPGLRDLLHADSGPLRELSTSEIAADRELFRRVIRVMQGHPKLLDSPPPLPGIDHGSEPSLPPQRRAPPSRSSTPSSATEPVAWTRPISSTLCPHGLPMP